MSFFTVTHIYSVFWIVTTDPVDASFPGHQRHPQTATQFKPEAPKAAFVRTWQERTAVAPPSSR